MRVGINGMGRIGRLEEDIGRAVAALFRYTVYGFEFDVLGRNRFAAIHAGLPVGRLGAAALLASGAFAGLAGANDILGVKGLFQGNWNPGYGFAAFALVYLARLSSLWIIPFAWFLSFLVIGGQMMARPLEIPTSFTEILEGLMLIFFAVAVFFERQLAPHDRDEAAEAQVFSPVDVEPIVSPEPIPTGGKAR